MPDMTLQLHGVQRIKADVHESRLMLSMRNDKGEACEFVTIGLPSAGLALRLAGAINLVQQSDVSPIYPTNVQRIA